MDWTLGWLPLTDTTCLSRKTFFFLDFLPLAFLPALPFAFLVAAALLFDLTAFFAAGLAGAACAVWLATGASKAMEQAATSRRMLGWERTGGAG